jgi:hypothetical protein
VTIERLVDALNEYGVRREAWTLIRTVKAQIIQASAEDFLSSAGVAAVSVMIFRVRFMEEITPPDGSPPTQKGRTSTSRRSKAIGRRRGLKIRANTFGECRIVRGRKPELSSDCDALTTAALPLVGLSPHRYDTEVTPVDYRIRCGVLVFDGKGVRVRG